MIYAIAFNTGTRTPIVLTKEGKNKEEALGAAMNDLEPVFENEGIFGWSIREIEDRQLRTIGFAAKAQVEQFIMENKKISAIKYLRTLTGGSLKACKLFMDQTDKELQLND